MPVHPVLVHFPVVLTIISPVILGILFYYHRKGMQSWKWSAVYVLFICGCTYAALYTGDIEHHEILESIDRNSVSESQITEMSKEIHELKEELEHHEHAAETFFLWTVLSALIAIFSVKKSNIQLYLQIGLFLIQPALIYFVYETASHGGELVYEYHISTFRNAEQ